MSSSSFIWLRIELLSEPRAANTELLSVASEVSVKVVGSTFFVLSTKFSLGLRLKVGTGSLDTVFPVSTSPLSRLIPEPISSRFSSYHGVSTAY